MTACLLALAAFKSPYTPGPDAQDDGERPRALHGRSPFVRSMVWAGPHGAGMPRVCMFHGISIWLYWTDHQPPHFHAEYAGDEVLVAIETLQAVAGSRPSDLAKLTPPANSRPC
ncbi:MAG: DUF4160 domain-containing protein [Candidatus Dormibacteraeota bacterium]|uniref:DUF4160 domain-containing protein n=1 Tax=Candidatus Amunia macphersoniae TaxID=3127014 RepID=A0A934KI14_9BACT|nr:DUF4160 domain-containing protein [Candidatus Dormibacteraeota bacterium]